MFPKIRQQVSNWASYYICFSKAAFFISGLVFSHAFVETAFFSVLMSFITRNWKNYQLWKAAAIVNAQESVSIFLAIFISYVADNRFGRSKVVVFTTAAFITGLVILCFNPSGSSGIFYLALVLVTLGKGGRSPTLREFFRDQFHPNPSLNLDTEEADQNLERAEARQHFWWRTAWFLGALVPTIISSILPIEKIVVKISTIITGVAFMFFLLGIGFRCYNKEPPPRLHMKNQRRLLRLIPIWLTFLSYCLVEAAGSTFFIEQSDNLEDIIGNDFIIPLTFFPLLSSSTSFLTSHLVDFLVSKMCKEDRVKRKHAFVVRIGIGMLVSFLCCVAAWQVEVRRLKLIKEFGDYETVPMNILWLTPQFLLLGLTAGLVEKGIDDSYYNLVSESMKYYDSPINKAVIGFGKLLSILLVLVLRGWLGDNSDLSHLDRYFRMLAILSIGALLFFTAAAYVYYWKIDPAEDEENILEDALQNDNGNESTSDTVEMVIQRSGSQHYTDESSTQSLVKRAASLTRKQSF